MTAPVLTSPPVEETVPSSAHDLVADLRARALADARRFRALARTARIDGLPKAALRAANATAAARSVLRHAQRLSALCTPQAEAARPLGAAF